MAVGESNQKARAAADYFAAGFWLGVSQVALGFHLLYSQGAAVIYYFALVSVWLAGSVIALVAIKSKVNGFYLGCGCLLVLMAAFIAARLEPFGSLSLLVLLLSGLVQGVFAGWFLKSRIACGGSVSSVMLHENNGFIVGYAAAGALLFFSISSLDLLALGSGVLWVLVEVLAKRGSEKP